MLINASSEYFTFFAQDASSIPDGIHRIYYFPQHYVVTGRFLLENGLSPTVAEVMPVLEKAGFRDVKFR